MMFIDFRFWILDFGAKHLVSIIHNLSSITTQAEFV